MLNKFFILFLFLGSFLGLSQDDQGIRVGDEGLSPIRTSNPNLNWWDVNSSRNLTDSTFVYFFDTLSLPIIDDFSKNRFQDYNGIDASGPNVNEVVYNRLFDKNQIAPLDDSVKYMIDTTYRIEVDTAANGSFTYNYIPLTLVEVFQNDLNEFPIEGQVDTLWPRYEIYDTLYLSGDVSDTIWLVPDVEQDSSRIFETLLNDSEIYWIDNQAYHNYHYAWQPKSLGVATFDGTDEIGYPYDFSNISSYGQADVLTSKPIDLSGLTIADSVYLTFVYQAGGRGEMPDQEDSLILEFFTPGNGEWVRQWTSSFAQDSLWRTVHIRFNLNALFENGFQFRFRNFANLSGSFDHWHIDYVRLRATSTFSDTLINDLAIMEPMSGLIQPYTYAPWKHYKSDPSFFMKDNYEINVTNNFNQSKLTDPGRIIVEYEGVNQLNFSVGDPLGNFNPATIYDFPFDISGAAYQFDPNVNDSAANFIIKSILTTPTNPELLNSNDTAVYEQDFRNYYAYDDGTAEAAYGPYGLGARLAYYFEMPQADTLLGAMMHFEPSGEDWSNTVFLLTVWEDNNGLPGNILYQDDFFTANLVKYTNGDNGFDFYGFGDDIALEVDESFFIGWEQIDPDKLNIGFDYNNNNQDKIFFNTNGTWTNTVFEGSLMIRPVVKSNIDFYLGDEQRDFKVQEKLSAKVYPNPAEDVLKIEFNHEVNESDWSIEVLSISGQKVRQPNTFVKTIDISSLSPGLLLVRLFNKKTGEELTQKVIKK